jgi:hypothetical protein
MAQALTQATDMAIEALRRNAPDVLTDLLAFAMCNRALADYFVKRRPTDE